MAILDGNCAAQRSMMRARFNSLVRFSGLVERFAADAVEAQLGGPRQHQGAAARIAVQALERQRLEHGLPAAGADRQRTEEHTSEPQSRLHLVCRLLLEKKKGCTQIS